MYIESAKKLGLDPRGIPIRSRGKNPAIAHPIDPAVLRDASLAAEDFTQKKVGEYFNRIVDKR